MILMAGDQESLPPALRHAMAGRGRFMRASEVPKSTQKLVQPVVVAGLRRVSADTPPDPYDRPIRSMMTISRAARPRTSWVRSATRSQLGRSRLCLASGHNLDGGPEIRGSVSDNLRNSKRKILSCVMCRDPVRASVRQPKKSVVYMATHAKTSESSWSRGP